MLELAGRSADGVIISAATSPEFVRWSLEQVRRGEVSGGRTIQKAALVFCSVDPDEHVARDRFRRQLAFILRGRHHARNLEVAGTRLDQTVLADAFAREAGEMIDSLVTNEVVRRHTATGTPQQVTAALAAYQQTGIEEIVAYGLHDTAQLGNVLAIMRALAV